MNTTPVKFVASINDVSLPETSEPDLEFRYLDISSVGTGRVLAEPQVVSFAEAPSRARRVVRKGDTIVSTVRTYLRSVWTAREDSLDLVASTGFAVLTPRSGVDPRYFGWFAQSSTFIDEVVARSVGVSYPAIAPAELGRIGILLPTLGSQTAIADYLDAETARIDALIEKKQRMKELIAERTSSLASSLIWSGSPWRSVRLRFLTGRPTSGNRDHSNFTFEAGGVTCLRGVNVRPNKLALDDAMTISTEDHRLHDETSLEEGDVVIVRSGFAGAAAAIPAGLGPCNCVDLVVVRRSASLVPDYLQYVINSARTQEVVRVRQAGAILSHFNAVDAGDIEVPVRPLEEQKSIALTTKRMLAAADRISDALDQQVDLLRESRQALITAAVTGQLEIPGVAA